MRRLKPSLFLLLALAISPVHALEFTGRFSMLAMTSPLEKGDWGYEEDSTDAINADQQSLRLMLDGSQVGGEWAGHMRIVRSSLSGDTIEHPHSSQLFRYWELSEALWEEEGQNFSTHLRYEVDRLYYRRHLEQASVSIGRQPIDWGSGRFWQPINLFGSFSPVDLDTDYKPGIDAAVVDYYPSYLSSLTTVAAFAPSDQSDIKDSFALHYRRQLGETSELALVAGSISGNHALGISFESAWKDIAWRLEGVHYSLEEYSQDELYLWIAGFDYQFDDGTLITGEYYQNSVGAKTVSDFSMLGNNMLLNSGLQQHLTHRLWGLRLSRDLTPLIQGGYTLLGSNIESTEGSEEWSLLHQLNLSYSVSNESDLLASISVPTGTGLQSGQPSSEFGHLPTSFTLRLRFYF